MVAVISFCTVDQKLDCIKIERTPPDRSPGANRFLEVGWTELNVDLISRWYISSGEEIHSTFADVDAVRVDLPSTTTYDNGHGDPLARRSSPVLGRKKEHVVRTLPVGRRCAKVTEVHELISRRTKQVRSTGACELQLPLLPRDWRRVILGRRIILLDPAQRILGRS